MVHASLQCGAPVYSIVTSVYNLGTGLVYREMVSQLQAAALRDTRSKGQMQPNMAGLVGPRC